MKTVLALLFCFITIQTSWAQTKTSKPDICEILVAHYTEVWRKHQKLSQEIQHGVPYPTLENYMKLLNLMSETLFDTAKMMERNNCELPEDF